MVFADLPYGVTANKWDTVIPFEPLWAELLRIGKKNAVALLEWLVKTYSNPGDVILDPTMGSGTTGVACANTQRYFVGIEKGAKYFETTTKRVDDAYALAIDTELFTPDGAIVQLDDLKSKVKSFVEPTVATPTAKKAVLANLTGIVSKKDMMAMSLQEVVEVLVTVMEIPEVQELNGETITLAELTRGPKKLRAPKAEVPTESRQGSDDDDSDDDEE